MNRDKVTFYPEGIRNKHYYALAVTASTYSAWDLREYTNFRKQFHLSEKAHAVVAYDRVINDQLPDPEYADQLAMINT